MKPNKQMRAAIKAGKEAAKRNAKKKCGACDGSGYYDAKGSPKCASCNGTGLAPTFGESEK